MFLLCRVYVPKKWHNGSTIKGAGYLMDKAEEKHIREMERLKQALQKTKSIYLRRDYEKALKRMQDELKEYRRFRYGHC